VFADKSPGSLAAAYGGLLQGPSFDYEPLFPHLSTEAVGTFLPGELFGLFMHYFHAKIKPTISHPRPIKFYLCTEP